jgi:uncharacterized protein YhhL (DUF1145 family)
MGMTTPNHGFLLSSWCLGQDHKLHRFVCTLLGFFLHLHKVQLSILLTSTQQAETYQLRWWHTAGQIHSSSRIVK